MYTNNPRKTIAIIQARMGSTRLPNKIMMEIGGKPIVEHALSILQRCKRIDKICLATSKDQKNKVLENVTQKLGVNIHFGSEDNVLERFNDIVENLNPEFVNIVRVCADSPFLDYEEIDNLIEAHEKEGCDLSTNYYHLEGLPCGAEVISRKAFKESVQLAKTDEHREHLDEWILQHPDKYKILQVSVPKEKRSFRISFAIDTQDDFDFMKTIVDMTTPVNNGYYKTEDLLSTLRANPEIILKKRLKIFVRADGDGEIGMGHIYRGITICESLREMLPKVEILFFSNEEARNFLNEYGYSSLPAEKIKESIIKEDPDIIVTDLRKYLDDTSSERFGKSLRVRFIDSEKERNVRGDLIINSFPINFSNTKSNYYSGLNYMPLRKGFEDVSTKIVEDVKEILVLLGGGDQCFQILKLKEVIEKFPEQNFTLVLGPGISEQNRKEVIETYQSVDNTTILHNVKEIKELMIKADIGISGGGNVLYEFARCGVPTLCLTASYDFNHDDHQQFFAKAFEDARVSIYLGHKNEWTISKAEEKLRNLILNTETRREMSKKGQQLIDGKATTKICQLIIKSYLK